MEEMSLQQHLEKLMLEKNLSQSQVSRALGISSATLNQWLKYKYQGDVEKVNQCVESFLRRQDEWNSIKGYVTPFVQITNSKHIFETARIAHLRQRICVAYGESGVGKTISVRQYAKENPDVILIEAGLDYTAKILFSELHKRVGYDGAGSIHSLFEDVVAKLKDSGRLIIIDEAEHLPFRALELLRRVYDKANIGILLVGMPRLIGNLRGKRGDFKQLYSRVAIAKQLDYLSRDDIALVIQNVLIDANDKLIDSFYNAVRGNGRALSFLVEDCQRIAELNNLELTPEVVKKTSELLIL